MSTAVGKRVTYEVAEASSAIYRARLLDDTTGLPIPVTELRLTLYQAEGVKVPTEILNGRDDQNVLNANGITYDPSTGELLWRITPEDMAIQDPTRAFERHVALFLARYPGGRTRREVHLRVRNLRRAA